MSHERTTHLNSSNPDERDSSGDVYILSPFDVKPGATTPKGEVVIKSTLYEDKVNGIIAVDYETNRGTHAALSWPATTGWKGA